MKDFFVNVSRYPRYLISIMLGVIWFALQPLAPLLRKPVTAIALISATISATICLVLILRAMLGLDSL
ncbi:MAG: DUF751 family protein [Pseudanabaenaceae cyanobacterium SKYGB_i_bin29]|nr:DUF751 family protein [Pseudanabaenaceae cyanobacterium SKYG29]MDW8420478.1 DUF751 family protein [Pseudanabaenaceae cyanobacterium SKYGB_i_bin29]